ncbi:MAG: hypothetical protein KBD78_00420 [Oligoflexales bacterium]|nr:hypothetical protein [Oligoflexales bacterium]
MRKISLLVALNLSFILPVDLLAEKISDEDIIQKHEQLGPQLRQRTKAAAKLANKKVESIDWNKEIIYFLLVDRFHDGNKENNSAGNPMSHQFFDGDLKNKTALKTYQGGDLQGVLDKLPYLKSLGVTTIWLSPVFENANKDYFGWWPYHGYHPVDLFAVEDHFGDMSLMKKLVSESQKQGLKILLDMTYNQVGPEHPFVVEKKNWKSRAFEKWFHPHSETDGSTSIKNWNDQIELETYELMGLPDFNQDNPNVYTYLLDTSKFWIEQTGADGFRLDAVKHVNKDFWKKINKDIKDFAGKDFLMLGEVFSGDAEYLAQYKNVGFDSMFDIPLYYTLRQVFAQGSNIDVLSTRLLKNLEIYGNSFTPALLIDNHDLQRFAHLTPDRTKERIKLALTFINTMNGIPVIYYGTEVALAGGPDVDPESGESTDYLNRRMMPWNTVTQEEKDPEGIIQHLRKLTSARKSSLALMQGQFIELYKDASTYIYGKVAADDFAIIGINASSDQREIEVPLRYVMSDLEQLQSSLNNQIIKPTQKDKNPIIKMALAPFSSDILIGKNPKKALIPEKYDISVSKSDFVASDFIVSEFRFKAPVPNASSVNIAGDFNGWNPSDMNLEYNVKTKEWTIKVPLKPGRYSYKFVVDGKTWVTDLNATEFEPDPYGGKNSIAVIHKKAEPNL